ncbi:Type II secretion system F domain protein (plasmid) [Thioalkalivibrio sp. K90mix]|uniref:type II secretion system F family protein n=1 Tax=Thioalkalivibrio sp. (strain K90mix) TaxID=396595 RepID=UPI000195A8CB|nr:type II secretion system F family protein [Thioalkalivibrio sp. K90mix]ADC73340.1 Type II secretion system F domain protein [Thioalkalivibrio sp. K90mix]
MATFTARIKNGSRIETVELEAPNRADALKQAKSYGHLISIKKAFSLGGSSNRLSTGDRAMLFQRLAAMIGSRVGTGEALRLIQETFKGKIARIAGALRKRIESGDSLVAAMQAIGARAFPETTLAIIRTGSQGGNMAEALREAIRFEQESAAIRKESSKGMWSAVGGFAAGVITLLATTLYVVPEMEASPMVQQMGAGQPLWVTITANTLTVLAMFITLVMMFVGALLFVVRPVAAAAVDRFIMGVPFFKDVALAKKNYIAFYGLSILLRAGLRVEEALRLSKESAPKGQTRDDFGNALQSVRSGRPWPYAMESLHPTDRAALATSQDRVQVAQSVEQIAIQYRDIYRMRIEQLMPAAQMGAALFLTAAGVVLFGAVIIPLLEMTQNAMGGM